MKHGYLAIITALSLSACATADYGGGYSSYGASQGSGYGYEGRRYESPAYQTYGVVETVREVNLASASAPNGTGAVLGAIIGGVVGHQIGGGSGKTAATIAGAGVGAYAGNRIQENRGDYRAGQEIVVRLDNGQRVHIIQPGNSLYSGVRVRVTGSGRDMRVYRL